ncbi:MULTISPECIES: bifunctional riboflavin kinase/FAD synthetase [unclassified Cytobacillus]|uniref:bifunctional riboflavin kinase/FAD synthetase n=1 Tax=unclassified Cytobacillus TaxID=2675268 RepID=UPI00135890F5|nr:bifunctional riboflavin kinase/FAD synthetase [Cytobacillus sp. AMY 15.2]KAF0820419.1 FMN adenylyltransferase [Bacillus sp. ZZV12-4809]MCM3089640.1 bifunctional riboflavin kinase/FAD synthetase [Cytobacillus sp. AMY 15.2]
MEVIHIHHPHRMDSNEMPELAIALGYFDGVHLGHQKVIREAKSIAEQKGLKSAVMTFDPHPSVVLGKSIQHVEYITPLEDKIAIMADLGIDYLFIINFTREFANLLPQEFVDQYLIGLNAKHVVAGFDYSYGRMGRGTMETLLFHSRDQFDYSVVAKLAKEDEKISSTRVRKYIREGKTAELPGLLGRFYRTSGIVIHGDKRGRTIGFPTANVDVSEDSIIPPPGVYAVRLEVDGSWYEGVCNVGYKPTFNQEKGDRPSVEVHIFDFSSDIYGRKVTVEWHNRLRSERKFAGIQELIAQIEKDKQQTEQYFEKNRV